VNLQAKKEELENIKNNINDKRYAFEQMIYEQRKKFEESLEPLKISLNNTAEEFNLLAQERVCVSLEDVFKELSNLTGISIFELGFKLKTNVDFWNVYNINELVKLMSSETEDSKNYYWELLLFDNKNISPHEVDKHSFCYDMIFDLNLEEIQTDGKTLLDHCSAEIEFDDIQGLYYTYLSIDKNIGALSLNITLNNLVKDDVKEYFNEYYPTNLLKQVVMNCIKNKSEYKHIEETLVNLQAKKEELENIKNNINVKKNVFEQMIDEQRKKFEESLEPLKLSLNNTAEEFNLLSKEKISISLGDLINELSNLTGINDSNFGIKLKTDVIHWGKYNITKLLNIMNNGNDDQKKYYYYLTLYADKSIHPYKKENQLFCYEMIFALNFEEIQADGKKLLDHCSVERKFDDIQGLYYTELVIDKNISELNLNISLDNLIKDDLKEPFNRYYPTNLLMQAVINCIENKKEINHKSSSALFGRKIRSRKLNF
ncbi:MAG: hypothetical protein ACI4XR_05025, partial [Bacilli bacterium]